MAITTPRGVTGTVLRGKTSKQYEWKGRHYPSVTSILKVLGKEALIYWAAGCVANRCAELMRVIDDSREKLVAHSKAPFLSDDEVTSLKATIQGCMNALRDADSLKREHTRVRDAAAVRGSLFHDFAEKYGQFGEAPDIARLDESIRPRATLLKRWFEENKPDIHFVETTVINEENGYAGTLDTIMTVGGRKLIVDFKTSKDTYPEHAFQLTAYRHADFLALDRATGLEARIGDLGIEGTATLIVNDTACTLWEWESDEVMFDRWLSLMDVWGFLSGDPKATRLSQVSVTDQISLGGVADAD